MMCDTYFYALYLNMLNSYLFTVTNGESSSNLTLVRAFCLKILQQIL